MSPSFQAGLFSAALTAFVVANIQNLKVNPADQSAYYQNQTVQMLDRISRQFTSVDGQTSTNYAPPLPYPTFHPSASVRRVNSLWLISLVCSLSAAFLAILVQQWSRAYIRVLQQSRNPLKAARIRLSLCESAERLPVVAEFVPGLIHISLLLFFWGLGDIILQIDTAVFVSTVVPIVVCVSLYLYCMLAPIWNPQLPYRTPFSDLIRHLVRRLHRSPCYNRFRGKLLSPASMEARQEKFAMKLTKSRMDRDVRAVQWLVERINDSDEMEAFILAIPGSFNQEWGRAVWKAVVRDDQSTSPVDRPHPGLTSLHQGTTVDRLCRCVRNVFENEGYYVDTKIQRMRMRRCIETTAFLVCCTNVELGFFGDITEVLSEVGDKEQTNDSFTVRSNPLFALRWTCLSLVAIWQIVNANRLQEITKFALDGIALFQTNFGSRGDVAMALTAAQKMDDYLKKAWAAVLDLRLALEPWSLNQNRTESEIRGILKSREASIQELERIAMEAADLEEIDWRIHLLQDTMDEVTHKLMRRLPGVFFDQLRPTAPSMTIEAFDLPSVKITPIPPQLVFPGQQLQSLCILGRRLRDITEGQNIERHEETVKSLKYLREVPIPLCGFDYVMKRQLGRLLDLCDGRGLGFTVELFFLELQQFSPTSSSEMTKALYTGTFNVITSNWKKSKNSAGTQRILVDILCDLVIQGRGIFSDFSYPPYIVEMLLDLVGNIVQGHGGSQPHINDITQELEDNNFRHRMDNDLRDKVLSAIGLPYDTALS